MRKSLKVVIVLALFTISSNALAVSVGGGTWNYGVCATHTCGYSDYHHPDNYHSSSVVDDKTDRKEKSFARAGEWSNARLFKIPPVGLSYYYNENE